MGFFSLSGYIIRSCLPGLSGDIHMCLVELPKTDVELTVKAGTRLPQ